MSDAIKSFAEQFSYRPTIENEQKLKKYKKYILSGMGGSHLAADLARIYDPTLPLIIRSDYGLPKMLAHEHRQSLFIASSYSGNTEEVVGALKDALKQKIPSAVISVNGQLIKIAKKYHLPFIQMPDAGIQPRLALGFSLNALFKLMGQEAALRDCYNLAKTLKPTALEKTGKELARKIKNHVPIIYCSRVNRAIAYNWKIKFNETGKIPAFYNVFPELNHNEMTGFSAGGGPAFGGDKKIKSINRIFYFIILKDNNDHPKISKRMNVLEKLYKKRGLKVETMELKGDKLEKIFNSLLLADWTAFYTAQNYGLEPEQVPMVEEFKNLIK